MTNTPAPAFDPGTRVWWVWFNGSENHGTIRSCGRYDVIVTVAPSNEVYDDPNPVILSFAHHEVYTTRIAAWNAHLERANREIDHFNRQLHTWIDRRSRAHATIRDIMDEVDQT